jgi:tripartite-type tricarboxylate transporter receptor subunit TctC
MSPAAIQTSSRITPAALLAAALTCATALPAFAQGAAGYPSKPVTLVLPYTPGANADLEARTYQEGLQAVWKHPLVVDYKPGASGAIANSYVAKSAPDGHTVGFINSSATLLPALRKDLPYDLIKDFAPVIMTTENIIVLLTTPAFAAQTFEEFVARAKARPGEVTWGTVGSGGGFHVGGEWLAGLLGVKLTFVHYKGGAAAEVDLLGGRLNVVPKQFAASLGLIKAGKVKVLGILTRDRSPLLPGVRTVSEMGAPEFAYPNWIGLVVTAATPRAIVDRLNADMVKAIKSPAAMKKWEAQATVAVASTPDEFRKRLAAEVATWDRVVREKNIKEE